MNTEFSAFVSGHHSGEHATHPLVFAAGTSLGALAKANRQLARLFGERQAAALGRVQAELDAARAEAERHAFTPEELAAAFPPFAGLTPEQREVLVLHFRPRTAVPGERIIRAGDPADDLVPDLQGRGHGRRTEDRYAWAAWSTRKHHYCPVK